MWFWLLLIAPILIGIYCGLKKKRKRILFLWMLIILGLFNFYPSIQYLTCDLSDWWINYSTGMYYSFPVWLVIHVLPGFFAYIFSIRAMRPDPCKGRD